MTVVMKKRIVRPMDVGIAAVAIVLGSGASFYGLSPFGTAMFCALEAHVFFGAIAPVYVLSSFLFTFDVWRLYCGGAAVFIMAARYLLRTKFKRFDREPARIAFSVAAMLVEGLIVGIFDSVVSGALTAVIGGVYYCFARPTAACLVKRFSLRPSATDCLGLGVTVFASGLAFGAMSVDGYIIGLAFAAFFILIVSATNAKAGFAVTAALALGMALKTNPVTAMSVLAFGVTAAAFRTLPRPLYSVLGLGGAAAVAVVLGMAPITLGKLAAMSAIGGALFVIVPRRAMRFFAEYFDYDGSARLATRYYINRTRTDAANKMLCLASVFDETARLLTAMRPPDPDYAAVGAALSERFCPYCANAGDCDAQARSGAFAALAENAYAGKPIIAELPEFFSAGCSRTSEIVGAAADVADRARAQSVIADGEKRARDLIVERMDAVGDVLDQLGRKQSAPVIFDGEREARVARELALCGVECAEVFLSDEGVTAIVRTATAEPKRICRAVSAALKKQYLMRALDRSVAAGWSVAALESRPKYDAVYARAGVGKTGDVNGDSYTFKRIGNKFLVALADGMGSGERASADSDAAVELIECFYRAGFDSSAALTGVNRFLKLPSGENYSAADVAVCDLDTGVADLIKLGSPPCYIRTEDTVLKVEGSSLPIGVLDEMRPFVTAKRLYTGQMLILATDGVGDCFDGDALPEYINTLAALNPERVARSILERALENVGGTPKDDMTVVAFRLFENKKRFGKAAA